MKNPSSCLLTPKSLSLSLAPPRTPPTGSSHDRLSRGNDPSSGFLAHRRQPPPTIYTNDTNDPKRDARIRKTLTDTHQKGGAETKNIHPHLPSVSEHRLTRFLFGGRGLLSRAVVNRMRDGGAFASIADGAVKCGLPALAVTHPTALGDFVVLSRSAVEVDYGGGGGGDCRKFDLFLPPGVSADLLTGFVFFVHGGAWGSGQKWMYRLAALPFLQAKMAVAIIGYRVYPRANLQQQVDDLQSASELIMMRYPHLLRPPPATATARGQQGRVWNGVTLVGHSSGAHIAMHLLLRQIRRCIQQQQQQQQPPSTALNHSPATIPFDSFIGLAGVYSIDHHFDYEANRGVEEISPMKPCCGYTREAFRLSDPTLCLRQLLHSYISSSSNTPFSTTSHYSAILGCIPSILLIHGVEDDTVPFTGTAEAARNIRACGVMDLKECYLSDTGHVEVVMELMLGGLTSRLLIDWLRDRGRCVADGVTSDAADIVNANRAIRSRL